MKIPLRCFGTSKFIKGVVGKMYGPEDIHGFFLDEKWKKDIFFVDTGIEREKQLLSCIEELEKKIEKLESNKKYEDIVRDIFEETEKEMFMGGKLISIYSITDDILFINSERRMDANMMATLQKHLNGKILHGSLNGDVLIILCGVRHHSKDGGKN